MKEDKKQNKIVSNKVLIILMVTFVLLLCSISLVGFSNNEQPNMLIKSVTPIYDENSTIVVNDEGITFNDKDQNVKYKIIIENPQSYDVMVSDIKLSTPTEEFLEYTVENLNDDVIKSNSTKELVVDFKTIKKEGWGRNFSDKLTADITFIKSTKTEEDKPTPEPEVEEESKEEQKEEIKQEIKEEDKQEEVKEESKEEVENIPEVEEQPIVSAPVATTEEVKETFTLIETFEIEENEIVFTEIQNVVDKQMIDVWIYSNPIYLGRFEVEVKDGKTKILGLSEALEKHNIEVGDHSLVLQSETGEKIGYVEVKINNNKIEKPNIITEIEKEDNKDNNVEKQPVVEDKKSNTALLVVLIIATGVTGVAIVVIIVKNKKGKALILLLALCPAITMVDADEVINLPITFKVSFKSQNVMEKAYNKLDANGDPEQWNSYWAYNEKIKNIYINNEISDLSNIVYEFDVTENKNGRVKAYLVTNTNDTNYFDLYLMAEGLIYANEDASHYFRKMSNLENLSFNGLVTSEVKDMTRMFNLTGSNITTFTIDLEKLDTSNVTNMTHMFNRTGLANPTFNLDLSALDTSKVTSMIGMFVMSGANNPNYTLDLSNFDTSNVTNMHSMFYGMGEHTTNLTLDLSSFDTSKVTDMNNMFSYMGHLSTKLNLNLGENFDTSNVTNMNNMFARTGRTSKEFILDLGNNFNTKNVTDMSYMFYEMSQDVENFDLELGNKFDTSNVTNMSYMFAKAGSNCKTSAINLGENFDTSKVVNMSHMFQEFVARSSNVSLDLKDKFNTNKVTDMSYMFYAFGSENVDFALNLGDKFDTSSVTNMSYMFYNFSQKSKNLNIRLTIKNPNLVSYEQMLYGANHIDYGSFVLDFTNKTSEIVDKIIKTDQTNHGVKFGKLTDIDMNSLAIGDRIYIEDQIFNIISIDDSEITMLSIYNIDSNSNKQDDHQGQTSFSNASGWAYQPGPKDIDIQTYGGNAKIVLNNYLSYLKTSSGISTLKGDLIKLQQLKALDCNINTDYKDDGTATCANSKYASWLTNGQRWWVASADPAVASSVWFMYGGGPLDTAYRGSAYGIRPVITITKEELKNYTTK